MADNSESESDFVVHVLRPALVYIRNADKYFIVPGEPCTPAPLETDDLVEFEKYCTRPLNGMTSAAVQTQAELDKLQAMQILDGGVTFSTAIDTFSAAPPTRRWSFPEFNESMTDLLTNGIVPLNNQGVVHYDIKQDNIVYDGTHVRLIDWDRAVEPRDWASVVYTWPHFQTLVQQPAAYSLLCSYAHEVISNAAAARSSAAQVLDALTAKLLVNQTRVDMPNRLHRVAEKLGENYARVIVNPTDQLREILIAFYDESTYTFNWDGYAMLLLRNYDVYGWLALNNLCWNNFSVLFEPGSVPAALNFNDKSRDFLAKYMYAPKILAQPYNIAQMIFELKSFTVMPSAPIVPIAPIVPAVPALKRQQNVLSPPPTKRQRTAAGPTSQPAVASKPGGGMCVISG